jgi:signal transduction histidine kinase
VLLNLLSNAIKFSSNNQEVKVNVSAMDLGSNVEVCLEVEDYGIGLTDMDLLKMFTPYFKTSDKNSQQMNTNSHGLGLNICQRIAENHNGKIFVKSKLNKGSIFTFKFLADKPPKPSEDFLSS